MQEDRGRGECKRIEGEERKRIEGEERKRIEGEEDARGAPLPHEPLTEEMLKEGLSLLCKTGNGLAHAFIKLDIKDRELTDIYLQSFVHLRYVDLSQNSLREVSPLAGMTHLLSLRVDQNQLLNASGLGEFPYLQLASFAQNRMRTLEGVAHPRLETLKLTGNQLQTLEGLDCTKLSNLHTLELRGNQLLSTAGLYLPNLRELYLAQNNLTRLDGLDSLVHLTSLHLRDNQLGSLGGISENLQALQYLNLRGNLLPTLKEVQKLRVLPRLRALVLRENPCEEEEGYRMETLIILPLLQRLDKDNFEEEERREAEETRRARLEETIMEPEME
ncbi:LOW QUALITY PROTEIN: leucine-rich repeat-containing protein 23-like [Discoglossus pictus]